MTSDEIVLIDDDRQCVDAVVDALVSAGYRVRTALNGEEAMDLLSELSPAMVIMNIHIPGVNGLRLLADFRRRNSEAPVLVISSEDRAAVHEQAMVHGANGILRKPFSPDVLLLAVRRLANRTAMCTM
jgi:DNA-binding response OmpR family regulator